MAFAYGDIYVANADMKDGFLIENKAMNQAGFKTGDKIVAVDGEKITKFDNDMNMKIVMGKQVLIERNGDQQTITMPIDFIDQLSKYEKGLLVSIRIPFVIGSVTSEANKALKSKDIITSLNGQKVKYLDEAKTVLENSKNKTIQATIFRNQIEMQVPLVVSKEGT
jgi:regulator of sigma E protease